MGIDRKTIKDREHSKFMESPSRTQGTAIEVVHDSASAGNAIAQLEAWKMQGLTTLTAIENNYNFDFVITSNGVPVLTRYGQFVIKAR